MIRREVIVPRSARARRLRRMGQAAAGVFIVGLLGSIMVAPRTMKMVGESKVDIAKLTVQKFANEAFPQWYRQYGGCPHSVYELTESMDSTQALDPWRQPYRMSCTKARIVVWSVGEDSIPNTGDDLRSND